MLDDYFYCTDRVAIITGPLGSGKTFTSCEKIFDRMCNQWPNKERARKTRFYAIRNTYPDLLGTTVKDWMDLFGDLGKYKGGGIEPPSHKLHFKLPDRTIVQSEFIFLALDRPQAIKKLRGAQATGFWLNEIKELPKAVIDMCDLRHGRYPSKMDGGPTWHGIIGDTNQVDQDHYLYELAEVTKPKGWSFFTQPGGVHKKTPEGEWTVNPDAENIINLPDDYYEAGMEGKGDEWIKVNLGNMYGAVSDGQAVYREQWNDQLHVNSEIRFIPDEPIAVGLDFGLTPAAIFGQQTARGTVNVLAELTSNGMGIRQFYTLVVRPFVVKHFSKASSITWVGDPAGAKRAETDEQTVFKELEDLGIIVEPANTNDITMRIEAVRFYLTTMSGLRPAFQLHPRCNVVRKGFNGGYKFRRIQVIGDERYMSVPDKNTFSHPHDGLQYLMMYYKGDTGDSKPFVRKKVTTRWGK
ncbi:MAG: TerL [Bacteroidetes bacterium]|nr:TerL [Bacteroidota bacterium]